MFFSKTTLKLYKKTFICLIIAGCMFSLFAGCSPVKIKQFVVELATGTGEKIIESAATLAKALEKGWNKFFPLRDASDKSIRITCPDKICGEQDVDLIVKVINPTDKSEYKIKLSKPILVRRKTINDKWDLSPENFPPGFFD